MHIHDQIWIRQNIHIYDKIIPQTTVDLIYEFYYIQCIDHECMYIGDIKLQKQWTMSKVKQCILKNTKFKNKIPKLDRMLIRDFNGNRLTSIYYDNHTLQTNCNLPVNFRQICVQNRSSNIKGDIISTKHVLFNCIRWYPQSLKLGPMTEIIFEKQAKKANLIKEIKMELFQMTGIKQDNFGFLLIYEHDLKQYGSPNFQHRDIAPILSFDGKSFSYYQIHKGHISLDAGNFYSNHEIRDYHGTLGDIMLYFDINNIPSQWNVKIVTAK